MPQFVSRKAAAVRDDPTEGENARLVIGVEEGHLPHVIEWIESHSGVVKRELPPGNLLFVDLPEEMVSGLCDVEHVESVEFNESIRILDRGN